MALYYGAIGRVGVSGGGLVSPAYEVFDVDDSVSPVFFEQLIRSPRMTAIFEALAEGGNQHGKRKNTSFEAFCTIRRPLPPRAEQDRIAAVLESVNRVLRETDRLIEQLRVAKQAVMRQLLLNGHPAHATTLVPLAESWPMGRIATSVERVPKHWRLVTLTHFAKLESGHTPSRQHPEYWAGDIPWLSLPDSYRLDNLEVHDADGRITPAGIANSSARFLPVGSVLLIRTGGSRGKCSRLGRTMTCSQDYVAFVPGPELDSRYLQQVFRHMQREWERLSDGSTTLRNIFMHAFKRLKILLPPLDEQRDIADVGEAYDIRIAAESRYLEHLRRTKLDLAQALFSGRLRVTPVKAGSARTLGAARGQ